MNGTYNFVYSADNGLGMGIFTVRDTVLTGADFGGCRYKGRVTEDPATGEIDMSFEMTVPAGVALVQSTSVQDIPYTKSVNGRVPPDFNRGRPFEMFIAPGMVTIMVKPMPDAWSAYASGFNVTIVPG